MYTQIQLKDDEMHQDEYGNRNKVSVWVVSICELAVNKMYNNTLYTA